MGTRHSCQFSEYKFVFQMWALMKRAYIDLLLPMYAAEEQNKELRMWHHSYNIVFLIVNWICHRENTGLVTSGCNNWTEGDVRRRSPAVWKMFCIQITPWTIPPVPVRNNMQIALCTGCFNWRGPTVDRNLYQNTSFLGRWLPSGLQSRVEWY
jgi:hypothetical protein